LVTVQGLPVAELRIAVLVAADPSGAVPRPWRDLGELAEFMAVLRLP
jgi:hypothetical protein